MKICGVDEFLNFFFFQHVVTNRFTQTSHHEGKLYLILRFHVKHIFGNSGNRKSKTVYFILSIK